MNAPLTDPIALTKALVAIPTITPDQGIGLAQIEHWLKQLGFTVEHHPFGEGEAMVDNLYAYRQSSEANKILCFAGHSDVVSAGDLEGWTHNPFEAVEHEGRLYGRGVADMKGAIAAFIAAIARLNETEQSDDIGKLALLITGDEEGPAKYGMNPLLQKLAARGERWDACVTGEPTNPNHSGEMIKIGRRGSFHGKLTAFGTQGHTGYPALADNAAHRITRLCQALINLELDQGNAAFEPSTLAISSIDVGNEGRNIVPNKAIAYFNIRFNNLHTGASLEQQIRSHLSKVESEDLFLLECHLSGESFLTEQGELSETLANACQKITGNIPIFSTTGGTSDSRFIKDYCPVVDYGLVSRSIHKINEESTLEELETLTQIYHQFIIDFFNEA